MKGRFLLCFALLLVMAALSVMVGTQIYTPGEIARALWQPDAALARDVIIHTSRLPRTLLAAAVGAFLAVAGALMQALTRNPLASPRLFGVNAGAALLIVLAGAPVCIGGGGWRAAGGVRGHLLENRLRE